MKPKDEGLHYLKKRQKFHRGFESILRSNDSVSNNFDEDMELETINTLIEAPLKLQSSGVSEDGWYGTFCAKVDNKTNLIIPDVFKETNELEEILIPENGFFLPTFTVENFVKNFEDFLQLSITIESLFVPKKSRSALFNKDYNKRLVEIFEGKKSKKL